ncbi:nuclear transport factor 2 family protein [Gammaproteobacteria bacterium]|nr:nuclear transport factor 2 family protein [Gammaproteobacteria bacterium]
MNVLFPMTGPIHYKGEEYFYPKPLISINGKLMIESSIEVFNSIENVKIIPIILAKDATKYKLDDVLQQTLLGCEHEILQLNEPTDGALCTCLLASDNVDQAQELVIANYDQYLDVDITSVCQYFRDNQADFGVISFDSVHPKWSYVKLDSNGMIMEAAEKKPISRNAIAGFYYFRSAQIFVDAAKGVLSSSSSDKEAYFISESINQCVLQGMKGLSYSINSKSYRNFYDANELKEFVRQSQKSDSTLSSGIIKKAVDYVSAFNNRDLSVIESMFARDCSLYDPNIGEISGRASILKFMSELFDNEHFSFVSSSIFSNENSASVEFVLTINNISTRGVDIITWDAGKIVKIYAYLESK